MLMLCKGVLHANRVGSGMRHQEQCCIQEKQGGPKMAEYPWEEGVEQTHWESSTYKGVAETLMFLKCLGDYHYRKTHKEMNTSVFSAKFGCSTVNSAWSHVADNKND